MFNGYKCNGISKWYSCCGLPGISKWYTYTIDMITGEMVVDNMLYNLVMV